MTEQEDELKELRPRFLGFTGGMKEGESMAEFVKRVNEEGKDKLGKQLEKTGEPGGFFCECVLCGKEIIPDFHLFFRGEGVCFHCAAYLVGVTKK